MKESFFLEKIQALQQQILACNYQNSVNAIRWSTLMTLLQEKNIVTLQEINDTAQRLMKEHYETKAQQVPQPDAPVAEQKVAPTGLPQSTGVDPK